MESLITRLIREDAGQDLIEYALLSALLGVACIAGILELSKVKQFFADVGEVLRTAL